MYVFGVSVDNASVQAVAKLSADNVVLLVKLRKAEARACSLAEEVSVLRAAVDSQSGTWFEDIHATVQRVTREGMQRADTLQARHHSSVPLHVLDATALRFVDSIDICGEVLPLFSAVCCLHCIRLPISLQVLCNSDQICYTCVPAGYLQHAACRCN